MSRLQSFRPTKILHFKVPVGGEETAFKFFEGVNVHFELLVPKNRPFGCFEILG